MARKLSVLLHSLWVTAEVYEIRSTTRIGAKSGRRQLKREAMEHRGGEDTLTEEAARQP